MKTRWLGVLLLSLLILSGCAARERSFVKPPALRPGDTIAFVSPAKWLDDANVEFARKALEARGYNVRMADGVNSRFGYLGGTDEMRARTLMDAFEDPEIDAVFPVTGGYGTTRMLDLLDYDVIRRNPKIVIGFSDITGLHLALQKKAGLMTFHSPFPGYMYAEDGVDRSYPKNGFWPVLEEAAYRERTEPGYVVASVDEGTTPTTTIVPGIARGRLTGGNLSLVHALGGTPYEIETKGRIVFFEDVREAPYRIDRMFSQLELSGKLDEPAGVVLGIFNRCEAEDPATEFTLRQVFDRYFADKPYPVVMNFPVGHVLPNATLAEGAMAELDATKGTLRILENPVTLDAGE